MARIERFEDIQAWQKGRLLNQKIYRLTGRGKFQRDFALRDQLHRAANSIMLNIAEGFARQSNKEFVRFLFIAHGSAAEVQAALYIAKDQQYITEAEFQAAYHDADEISRLISGFIKYLRNYETKK